MNMGIKKFKVYWNNELRHRVHWVKTARGDRVVLEDIMREAFPDIENQIGLMCIDVLYRQAELRKRTQLNVLREAL